MYIEKTTLEERKMLMNVIGPLMNRVEAAHDTLLGLSENLFTDGSGFYDYPVSGTVQTVMDVLWSVVCEFAQLVGNEQFRAFDVGYSGSERALLIVKTNRVRIKALDLYGPTEEMKEIFNKPDEEALPLLEKLIGEKAENGEHHSEKR